MWKLTEFQLVILSLCLHHKANHGSKPWLPPSWVEQNPEFIPSSWNLVQQSLIERRGLTADGDRWLWEITENGCAEVANTLQFDNKVCK